MDDLIILVLFFLGVFLLVPLPLAIVLLVMQRRLRRDLVETQAALKTVENDLTRLRGSFTSTPTSPPEKAAPVASPVIPAAPKVVPPPLTVTETPTTSKPVDQPPPLPQAKPSERKPELVFDPEPEPSPVFDVMALLRKAGLLPPRRGSGEAQLMQWWAPRLGGLLAIIAAVFFAIYVARDAAPWLRFAQLLSVSLGIAAFGRCFLMRRHEGFGRIVYTTGLSMLYFTSVAAYAAAPVRVVTDPILGVALQIVVLAILMLSALRDRDRTTAVLWLVFGYASALFSAMEGLQEGALLLSLVLYCGAVLFHRRLAWAPVLVTGAVGAYAPVLGFVWFGLHGLEQLPRLVSVGVYLTLVLSLYPLVERILPGGLRFRGVGGQVLHAVNTSLALASGYAYLYCFAPASLTDFYGLAALVMLAWAAIYAWPRLGGFHFELFFIKGSLLLTLWLINTVSGELRWYAVLLQALAMAFTVRRSRSPWLEGVVLVVAAVSLGLLMDNWPTPPAESWDYALLLSWPVLAIALLALLAGAFERGPARFVVYGLSSLLVGVVAIAACQNEHVGFDLRAGLLGVLAAVMTLPAVIRPFRPVALVPGCGLALGAAYVLFWQQPYSLVSLGILLLLALAGLVVIVKATRGWARWWPESLLHVGWIVAVYAWGMAWQEESWFMVLPAVLALALLTLARRPLIALADCSVLPLLLLLWHGGFTGTAPWAVVTLVLVAAYGFLPLAWPGRLKTFSFMRLGAIWPWTGAAVLLLWLYQLLPGHFSWVGQQGMLCAAAVLGLAGWLWRRKVAWLVVAMLSFAWAGLRLLALVEWGTYAFDDGYLPWNTDVLWGGLLPCVLLVAAGLVLARFPARWIRVNPMLGVWLSALSAIAAYALFAAVLFYPPLHLTSLLTPLLAGFCLLLLGLGMVTKVKTYRVVALVGFLFPLVRLFAYDVKDLFYRIIAFAALALLLMLIGYLYTRFQDRIR